MSRAPHAMVAAGRRAADLYDSKDFRMTYVRGAYAATVNRPRRSPYDAGKKWAAWRSAWLRGYDSIKLGEES